MISIEFLGGLELMAGNYQNVQYALPCQTPLGYLAQRLADDVLVRDKEVFCYNCVIQNGIITLINDYDVAILSSDMVSPGDKVTFISMVHGG